MEFVDITKSDSKHFEERIKTLHNEGKNKALMYVKQQLSANQTMNLKESQLGKEALELMIKVPQFLLKGKWRITILFQSDAN